ncbi:glycosyl hydrolase family 88 [Siphonobacter curvatus]|uniref:Glycosyl hydrolase family 88 n=2 Tax=Siphonobacter curvatus TaxID=2094562 RepID=A0A2S7IJN2_9BACT|nr:glycosyl hydrolase family 88 [Siphonobacter curvatus]
MPAFIRNLGIGLFTFAATAGLNAQTAQTSTPLDWAVRMADSDMQRNPKGWMLDFSKEPRWNYCHGLVCTSLEKLWKRQGNPKYYAYIKAYADDMIQPNGTIKTYSLESYNIDWVNPGKFVFALYEKTGDEKYKKALTMLRDQMRTHPRTSEGGFWHKKRYPSQMWLDGLYMATPFLAQYANTFQEPELFDEVARQITLIDQHNKQPGTNLYVHGWDESRTQAWADSLTGRSPHVWGRGMGWYAMTLVDVLDYFPQNHPKRTDILRITKNLAETLQRYQDPATGLWYQVMDAGPKAGNYLESSASTMLAYFLVKAGRQSYASTASLEAGKKAYRGILTHQIRTETDGTLAITDACAGAGLGGTPYRSGTFAYYVQEAKRDNDPKSVGPFILLALEMDQLKSSR